MKKQVFNPYLPSYEYVPDGEPRIFGDRLYVYGSHDTISVKVKCSGNGVLRVGTDLKDGLADITINPSDQWTTYEGTMSLPEKEGPLYFTYLGTGRLDFDNFEIASAVKGL